MMSSTLECGSSVVNTGKKNNDFQLLVLAPFWISFWRCFGSPNGGQGHQKATSTKTSKKWCPKWAQTGPKGGPKMEPKSSKMRSWKHLVSRVAPKRPPDPLQDRFWRGFATILAPFSSIFLTYFWWFLQAFFSNMLQTNTFKITRTHQKNAAERFQETASLSSCHLALKSSLANVNELSGTC